MSRASRVCIVTPELYPLTPGGIGRLISNLIHDSRRREARVEFHLLFPCWAEIDLNAVRALFGDEVRVHRAPSLELQTTAARHNASYPPRWAFTDTPHHADSLELLLELKRLEVEEGLTFDVVEFPDYLGWAFCSLQEKRLGHHFAETTLAVRVHATAGLIQQVEGQALSRQQQALYELERRALEEADVVVAHLPTVADTVQRTYGFSDGWRRAVRVEFPPVIDGPPATTVASAPTGQRDLVFVTKVQPIKRPDLFVKGAALFMLRNPTYKGKAVVACHVSTPEYAERVRAMVPAPLSKRFIFTGPGQGRDVLMARSIVVIPSDFEALNLTAYEAQAVGAVLVLNGQCPAFAEGSPFRDGVNAHLFDGSIEGLATVLERATTEPVRSNELPTPAVPYFERRAERKTRQHAGRGKVSVLVTNFNLARYLPQCLASIGASTYRDLEVVLVDDASTDPLDLEVLNRLKKAPAELPIKVIRNVVNRGLSASRNIGLAHCAGEFVLPLDADDCIHPRFLESAVTALTTHEVYDVVVPTAGYFTTDEALSAREFIDYAAFIGNVPSLGLLANRFSCATSLMRTAVLRRFPYDERLDSFEDWSVYLRMAHTGVRFLVTNDIGFFYRRRPGSMVGGIDRSRHERLVARMFETLPIGAKGVQLRFLAGLMSQWGDGPVQAPAASRSLSHHVVDEANALVKKTPIHGLLKKGLRFVAPDESQPLRYALADRLTGRRRRTRR